MMFEEKPARTLIKTLSWRIIAVTATVVAFYWYSGNLSDSLKIGVLVNLVKMGLYYAHERAWNKIQFGREQKRYPEYSI